MPMQSEGGVRRRFTVTGQVQGVGFRPFVFRLAEEKELTGTVRNTPEGVAIEVQGSAAAVEGFARDLVGRLPRLARIVSCEAADLAVVAGEREFAILASDAGHGHHVLISPDVATCDACLAEIMAPNDRRYLYPFTNCTDCGPRYTITRSVPYDRDKTSMACFPMCPECAREYGDPRDRRFHAQPNACPVCGPRVWLAGTEEGELAHGDGAVRETARRLAAGEVLAIKGLGGFHLACDAASEAAVARLRERKHRYGKPLAVMVPDLETARLLARLTPAEEEMLEDRARPILLVRRSEPGPLARGVAEDTDMVGVMLPYTPLHHILLLHYREAAPGRVPALVMTSGNLSSEPIALGNREALARLASVADAFLLHNRDILVRADDSVLRINPETRETQFFRRSRGFTPSPIFLAESGPTVMGLGPELKATLCLTKENQAFLSQHIGDLENLETFGFYKEIAEHLSSILQVRPELYVRDLHPDYMSSAYARERADRPVLAVQHHFAHVLALMAERQVTAPVLGLALDGTGLGEDGSIWGGELLFVDPGSLEMTRLGSLSPVLLPGGEAAVREPWRMARSYLHALGVEAPTGRPWPWLKDMAQADAFLGRMLKRRVNCPTTTSTGRLFDAVAGLLGLSSRIAYEGQAAIVLERAQDHSETGAYPCPLAKEEGDGGTFVRLDTLTLFGHVLEDWEAGTPAGTISRRFHLGLCRGLADMALDQARRLGIKTVGLSGGVMQNMTVSLELPRELARRGLAPLSHVQVPPGDGCISLGQAYYGLRALALGKA